MEIIMFKNKNSVYTAFFYLLLAASVVMAATVSVTLYLNYDARTQLTEGTLHTVLMALIVPVFGVIGLVWSALLKKTGQSNVICAEKEGEIGLFGRISCMLCAVAGVFVAVSYFTADYTDPLKDLLSQPAQTAYYTHVLSVALAVCAAVAFVTLVFGKDGGYSPVRQLPLVGFALLYLIRLHTDMSVMLMSTRRMICVFGICMLLLFLMAKIRVLCSKQAQLFYIVSGSLAAGTLIISGVSSLVLNLTGVASDGVQLFFYIFELTLGVYVLSELARPMTSGVKVTK